jgi:hypothetical protein
VAVDPFGVWFHTTRGDALDLQKPLTHRLVQC